MKGQDLETVKTALKYAIHKCKPKDEDYQAHFDILADALTIVLCEKILSRPINIDFKSDNNIDLGTSYE